VTFDDAVNKINNLSAENKSLKRRVTVLEKILNSTLHRLAENASEYKDLCKEEVEAE
jgi:hypothetical protein